VRQGDIHGRIDRELVVNVQHVIHSGGPPESGPLRPLIRPLAQERLNEALGLAFVRGVSGCVRLWRSGHGRQTPPKRRDR